MDSLRIIQVYLEIKLGVLRVTTDNANLLDSSVKSTICRISTIDSIFSTRETMKHWCIYFLPDLVLWNSVEDKSCTQRYVAITSY